MIGTHPNVGFKFGRWLDTVMMQRLQMGGTHPNVGLKFGRWLEP